MICNSNLKNFLENILKNGEYVFSNSEYVFFIEI